MANELRHNNYYYFDGVNEMDTPYSNLIGRLRINDEYQYYVDFEIQSNEMLTKFSYSQIKPIKLIPSIMQDLGFHYKPCRISGADMWQGMPFWSRGEFYMRGSLSTAKGGILHLPGFYNTQIQHLHQLQNLFYSITDKELSFISS